MADKSGIEQIVARVVTQVLESHQSSLRDDLVNQVLAQIQAELADGPADAAGVPTQTYSADLLKAVSSIHSGSTQKEILTSLLDNSAHYRGRAALFVIKSGTATGWQGRNFSRDEIKDFMLDVHSGLVSQVISSRTQAAGASSDMDSHFISKFDAPADGRALLLPLLLKDKLAAIVYVDAGTDGHGKVDAEAMGLLVIATSAWLEVASLRKQLQREGTDNNNDRQDSGPAIQAVSSAPDPFAAHAPIHTAAVPAPIAEPAMAPEVRPSAMAAAASASSSTVVASPQDEEIHRKAQRFARLLMDEIKLYNQAKVNEGRKHKDLYDRLKEDIEKSRSTYKKRYGNTPAASGDYFNHELLRSLAEDDIALMGANFRPS